MYINIVLALIFAVYFDTFFRVINLLVFYRNFKKHREGFELQAKFFFINYIKYILCTCAKKNLFIVVSKIYVLNSANLHKPYK